MKMVAPIVPEQFVFLSFFFLLQPSFVLCQPIVAHVQHPFEFVYFYDIVIEFLQYQKVLKIVIVIMGKTLMVMV